MRYGYVDAFGLCRQKQWSLSEGQSPICVTVVVHTCGHILEWWHVCSRRPMLVQCLLGEDLCCVELPLLGREDIAQSLNVGAVNHSVKPPLVSVVSP